MSRKDDDATAFPEKGEFLPYLFLLPRFLLLFFSLSPFSGQQEDRRDMSVDLRERRARMDTARLTFESECRDLCDD